MLVRATPPVGSNPGDLQHQSALAGYRTRARRQWIFRAAASLILTAVVLILTVVLRRDRMTINECVRSLDRQTASLQTQVAVLGQLPAFLPETPSSGGLVYADDVTREYARAAAPGPVIVATSPPISLILRPGGRGVILLEKGRLRTEWWTHSTYIAESREQAGRIREWNLARRAAPPRLPE